MQAGGAGGQCRRAVQRGRCSGRCSAGAPLVVARRCGPCAALCCAEGRVRRCAAHQGQHHHGSDRHDNIRAVAARGRRGIGAFPPPADVAQQRRHRLLRERQRDREGEVRQDRLRGERRDDRSRVPHGEQQPDLHGAHRRRAPWQVVRQRVVRRLRYEDRAASIHRESAVPCRAGRAGRSTTLVATRNTRTYVKGREGGMTDSDVCRRALGCEWGGERVVLRNTREKY